MSRATKYTGVYQRCTASCPQRCKAHSFGYRVELGRKTGGVRDQRTRQGYATAADARDARAEIVRQYKADMLPKNRNLTVAQWLEQWMAARIEASTIRKTTARSYRQHVDDFLIPYLGSLKLTELKATHVEQMFAHIRQDRTAKIRKAIRAQQKLDAWSRRTGVAATRVAVPRTFGPSSQHRLHATLRKALNDAVRRKEIPYNVARYAEIPKTHRPRVSPWDPAEFGAFLDAINGHRLMPMFHLAGHAGLRRGELLGLRWSDINLRARILIVHRQITCVGYRAEIGKPKTKNGEHRRVYLARRTITVLKRWRERQNRERREWDPAHRDSDYVFTRLDGSCWHPDRITTLFGQLVEQSGARHVRLHDLRHQTASLLLAAGVDIAIVSKMLGHSSIVTTVDTYVHLIAKVGNDAADKAAALVPRPKRQKRRKFEDTTLAAP